jgi:hypothetical protein
MKTARRSADPDASDLSLILAAAARYAGGAWLLYVIPTALYTMHADGIAALFTYIFKTPQRNRPPKLKTRDGSQPP